MQENKPIKLNALKNHESNWKTLEHTVKLYKEVGKRNIYLFDWLLYMWENLYLSCVDLKCIDSLSTTKTKVAILDTLIDDVADSTKIEDDFFLNELSKFAFERKYIEWNKLNQYQIKYIKNTLAVWDDIIETIKKYPRFEEFKRILEWDVNQVINSMKFAHLVNTVPNLNNLVENRAYGHHSMTVIMCGTIDLMCSPSFDMRDFSKIRKVLYYAQQLARIGNMINTYPREINEEDISSEILTMAIEDKIIDSEKLKNSLRDKNNVVLITQLVKKFDEYWDDLYFKIKEVGRDIKSIDINEFLRERKFIQQKYEERVKYWLKDYADKRFVEF
ncbi:MAG: hypothetical protein HYW05_03265 [Candidatus Diapherotrites archaeon]|nr:hypothetical protein [Candidatus Diapherotrites archaeon]